MLNIDGDMLSGLFTAAFLLCAAAFAWLIGRRSASENQTEKPLTRDYRKWVETPKK